VRKTQHINRELAAFKKGIFNLAAKTEQRPKVDRVQNTIPYAYGKAT